MTPDRQALTAGGDPRSFHCRATRRPRAVRAERSHRGGCRQVRSVEGQARRHGNGRAVMSSFCATCGRQRNGTERFCAGCGAEFNDCPRCRPGERPPRRTAPGSPPDATRADPASARRRRDQPAAEPDPFASWYQPAAARRGPGTSPAADADGTWQPTETVYAATGPAGPRPTRPRRQPATRLPARPALPARPRSPARPPPAAGAVRAAAGRPVRRRSRCIVVLAAGGGAYALANSLGKHSAAQPPASRHGAPRPRPRRRRRRPRARAARPAAAAQQRQRRRATVAGAQPGEPSARA